MVVLKTKEFTLRPFKKGDEVSLQKNINNEKIYRNTFNIPHPYTLKMARDWIREKQKKKKATISWAIDMGGEVVGGIGFHNLSKEKGVAQAEVGYWLAEQHWGKGIMTKAVKLVAKYGFEKLKLIRIQACVYKSNKGSARVLEKAGFKLEGIRRKNAFKDGKYIDDFLYAKVK